MNLIKQKIAEIGLSHREISRRLGKNQHYFAGVFRSGLSTDKQIQLYDDLCLVHEGHSIKSNDEILAELCQRLHDEQDQSQAQRDKISELTKQLGLTQSFLLEANQDCEDYQQRIKVLKQVNILLIIFFVLLLGLFGFAIF